MKRLSLPVIGAALALFAAAALWGAASASRERLPVLPKDPESARLLTELEAQWPAAEDVEKSSLRVPSKTLSLGVSNPLYRCWQLSLTGERALQILGLLERLKALQDSVRTAKKDLLKEASLYAAQPGAEALSRVRARSNSLKGLLAAYKALLESGRRMELLKVSEPSSFTEHLSVSGALREEDYVMSYDDALPECPPRGSR
ncbi:MAG: hypothetical protein WCU88_07515 [Elusimicrobiota bacterium]|jgi:hypothetical protein